ncbi:MAG: SDR family oxidoreductase, partial [Oscillospiraceae bacterium]
SHYASANAALLGLTKSLATEEGPSGIRVNCVSPGARDPGMMKVFSGEDQIALCEDLPRCRLGSAQDVANAVVFLASDAAAYITGQVLGVNGGMVM